MDKIIGSFKVRTWINKDGYKCYALCLDLVYTLKFLTFKVTDIAEILGLSVRDFVDRYPVDKEPCIFEVEYEEA